MRHSSVRVVVVGVLTLVLVLPGTAWASNGNDPDKGDDQPSSQQQKGSGKPSWAKQGPPSWAMRTGTGLRVSAACRDADETDETDETDAADSAEGDSGGLTEAEQDECRAEREAVRAEREKLKAQWREERETARAERQALKAQWRAERGMARSDDDAAAEDAPR